MAGKVCCPAHTSPAGWPSGLRQRFAKPSFAGSNPAPASFLPGAPTPRPEMSGVSHPDENMRRIGIYAGSFDPPTNGHLWMIRRGAELFDELVVALAVNPEKTSFLSTMDRQAALEEMARDLGERVRVAIVKHGFLVDFAREAGATHLLRGLRGVADFEYEKTMARMNGRMEPGIETVMMVAPSELEEISSSLVRGFVGTPGWERWVAACVHPAVFKRIKARQPSV